MQMLLSFSNLPNRSCFFKSHIQQELKNSFPYVSSLYSWARIVGIQRSLYWHQRKQDVPGEVKTLKMISFPKDIANSQQNNKNDTEIWRTRQGHKVCTWFLPLATNPRRIEVSIDPKNKLQSSSQKIKPQFLHFSFNTLSR